MTTSADLLAAARDLLKRTDPGTAGLWPRAAALLARQALETSLDDFWREKGVAFGASNRRPQLICLRRYVDQNVAGCAGHAWAVLSQACHHHTYDLAPVAPELQSCLDVVRDLDWSKL